MSDASATDAILELLMARSGNATARAKTMAVAYIAKYPEDPTGYSLLGSALQNLGKHELAVSQYGEAINRAPDEGSYRAKRANCLYKLGRYAEAAQDYEAYVPLDRGDDPHILVDIRTHLAECYYQLGEFDRAEAVCHMIPNDVTVPAFRGLLNGSKHFILADIAAKRQR